VTDPRPRRDRTWLLLFAGVCFLYLYFIPYFRALNNPNENARVYPIRAVVELHKLSVNEQITRFGMVNDLARRGDLLYSGKAPGTTFLGAPIYAALRAADRALGLPVDPSPFRLLYTLRLAGTLLPTLGFIYAFRRFLGRFVREAPVANALTLALALGSMLLPYALIFVNHSLTAACAFGTVIAAHAAARAADPGLAPPALRATLAPYAWMSLAGFLIAFSAALDYALLPVAILVLLYVASVVAWRAKLLAAAAAGALGPSIATAIYHWICWGSPFKTSIGFLANPTFLANQSKGLFGIVGMTRESMFGILVSPSQGLLFFSPISALGLIAAIAACIRSKYRRIALLSASITVLMIVYVGSLTNWYAGWTVGPRYAAVIVPFLIFSMALAWRASSPAAKRLVLPIAAGLGVASILITTLTSVLFPHLPPEHKNPFFEIILPLWRDAFTPHSLGRALFGLEGRAAQIPFLAVLGALLLYLVWVGSGSFLRARDGTNKFTAAASSAAALLVVGIALYLGSLPRTEPRRIVDAGSSWIRKTIWEPRPKTEAARPPRR
jgi:hypothetical protein